MIKRDALDNWFSLCVRERAYWTCERTKFISLDGQAAGKSQSLECCHIYGRRNKNVRWNGMNAVSLTHYEQGSPEWLEARKKHFCASEAPAVM